MSDRPCPFCHPDPGRIVARTDLALALRDAYPLAPGHTLIVPARHVASWFDTTEQEGEPDDRAFPLALLRPRSPGDQGDSD